MCSHIAPVRLRACVSVFVLRPLLFAFHSFLPHFQERDEMSKKLDNERGLIFEKIIRETKTGVGENTKVLEGERYFFI